MTKPQPIHLSSMLAIQPSTDGRSIDVVACTANVNDHCARIDMGSWDLSRYLQNPVCLYGHNDGGLLGGRPEDSLPIGKATSVRVEGDQLLATIEFAPVEVNPLAEKVRLAFLGGYLNAVSVGFVPHEVGFELVDGEEIAVLAGCELYEISVVPLPADPGAVAVRNASAINTIQRPKKDSSMALRTKLSTILKISAEEAPVQQGDAPPAEDPAEKAEDQAILDAVASIQSSLDSILAAIQGDEQQAAPAADAPMDEKVQQAIGVVLAGRQAMAELSKLSAKVASVEKQSADRDRADLIAKLETEKKLTPAMRQWAASCELPSLRAFAAVAAPVVALSGSPVVEAKPAGAHTWESMTNMERHALFESDRAAFEALRADFNNRIR